MNNNFVKASLIRAIRTICQTAVSLIGTAVVISDVNWGVVVSASLLSGLLSILTSIATGLPEVEYAEHVHMSADEPEDSYIDDDYFDYEVFDYGDEIGIEEGDYGEE